MLDFKHEKDGGEIRNKRGAGENGAEAEAADKESKSKRNAEKLGKEIAIFEIEEAKTTKQ